MDESGWVEQDNILHQVSLLKAWDRYFPFKPFDKVNKYIMIDSLTITKLVIQIVKIQIHHSSKELLQGSPL